MPPLRSIALTYQIEDSSKNGREENHIRNVYLKNCGKPDGSYNYEVNLVIE